jgi:hypothetical protein
MFIFRKLNVKRVCYQKDAYLEQNSKEITIKIIKRQEQRKVSQARIYNYV